MPLPSGPGMNLGSLLGGQPPGPPGGQPPMMGGPPPGAGGPPPMMGPGAPPPVDPLILQALQSLMKYVQTQQPLPPPGPGNTPPGPMGGPPGGPGGPQMMG